MQNLAKWHQKKVIANNEFYRQEISFFNSSIWIRILYLEQNLSGKATPWTGRFYSLLEPSYAKNNIPIIAWVSEHQPTAWHDRHFTCTYLQILTSSLIPKRCIFFCLIMIVVKPGNNPVKSLDFSQQFNCHYRGSCQLRQGIFLK